MLREQVERPTLAVEPGPNIDPVERKVRPWPELLPNLAEAAALAALNEVDDRAVVALVDAK